jgi:PAS domain S-box-containing protein
MEARFATLFHNTFVGYLFAIATVASTFALGVWLIPFTGTGAPFVLFFAAVLVISLAAGIGPGICAIVLSAPLAAYTFATRAGDPPFQAAVQGLLFAVDGIVVVYLAFRMRKEHQAAQDANQRLRTANEEIIKSMMRTREVIELAPDAFFQADLDGCFTDVNEAACRLLGYERDELIGKTIFDIIPAEDADRLRVVKADLLLPGRANTAEWAQKRKDGTFVPVEVSSNILPDGRWEAFARDVTERKRAEQALQESEERFRLTIDEAPIGMALVALDGRFVRVNRALCEIVGYSSTELTGLTFEAISHPDGLDLDLAARGQLARGEIPRYHREKRYIRKDGTIVDVLLNVSTLRSRDGAPLYFISQIEDITARKRAEEVLQRSERELRELAESMPQIVWATSADGRNIYFNQQWVDYTGLTLEESYGDGWITPFHPDDRQRAWNAWQHAVQHRHTYSLEGRLRRADGVYQWWLIRGVPLLSANGEIRKWFGTCTDIEQIKRIEQELKDANAFLDAIIENIPLTLFIKESQSLRFVRFNRAGEDLLGRPRQTFIGKTVYDLWPQAQADFFTEKDRETLDGGKVVDIAEEPVETRHQGVRFVHTRKVPIHDAQGHAIYLLGISEDITERRRIEKERQFLAEANVALSSSLDYDQTVGTVAQLVVRDFADWCLVDIMEGNENFRRLKVASADPANAALCTRLEQVRIDRNRPYLARPVVEQRQPLLIEHVSSEYVESVAQGPEHLEALRSIGATSLMAVPLLMRGQLLGTITLVSSTPSRLYGPDDLRLALALADRAAVAIENARLYRASVDASQLRDQVLGVVAHDLRNPLSTILLHAGTLTRHGPDPERRSQKRSEAIYRAATRMNRLIQDLLDVAVIESGELTIKGARLSARELIVGAADTQRPLAATSSLELRVDFDGDLPDIWGDRDRLLQVFENLIGNAIKFTKAGGRITVGATSRDHEVVFRVADTGLGIAPENLPRVFDRFWQATSTNRQGAGLGLPITKGIVEAHGGRIWVESTPHRGTTFSFTIPKATPEQGRPPAPGGSSLLEAYRAA